jgi:hypothetical protein
MVKCREMAIGYLVRPDGYRCELCERHFADDWRSIDGTDGVTVGRYQLVDRDPRCECQRIVPDMEIIHLNI